VGRLPVSIWQQVAAITESLVGRSLMHDRLWQPATVQNDKVALGLQAAEAKDLAGTKVKWPHARLGEGGPAPGRGQRAMTA
jgi:hypothetical protein